MVRHVISHYLLHKLSTGFQKSVHVIAYQRILFSILCCVIAKTISNYLRQYISHDCPVQSLVVVHRQQNNNI